MIINVHSLDVKYLLFVSDSLKNWNFLDKFSKNTLITNFMKIRPVVTELFSADRRTDDEANIRFSHFTGAPKFT